MKAQKRHIILVALLALFLLPIANPSPYSMPPAIGLESNEKPFFAAADGDESSESITPFSETLADDVRFYPDAFWNGTTALAYWGTAGPDESENDYTYTHSNHLNEYIGRETTSGTSYAIINFTHSSQGTFESFDYAVYCAGANDDDEANLWVYDWTAMDWDLLQGIGLGIAYWENATGIAGPYSDGSQLSIMVNSTDADSASEMEIAIAHLSIYTMTLADSDHYAEGFNGVSDWTTFNIEAGDTFTSDGDLGNFVVAGTSESDYVYSNSPSITVSGSYYAEFGYSMNVSSGCTLRLILYEQDDHSGTSQTIVPSITETTKKSIVTLSVIESVLLAVDHGGSSAGRKLSSDYLRIGPADEFGWQHDGSTTAGTENDADADVTYTTSSDDDILTMKIERTGAGSGWSTTQINIDTTATSCDIESDYYPFLAVRVRLTWYGSVSESMVFEADARRYTFTGLQNNTWHTYRANFKAQATSGEDDKRLRFTGYMDTVGEYLQAEVDWAQAYLIANFSLTQSGAGTDDYLYVDSGVLYSNIDDGYIELNHDPALSVSDTYSVYNLTTSGTAPQFSQYVSEWSTYSDDTRGATTSGTVTDIKLKFDSIESIAAIKFIEDGTVPLIVRSSANPPEPNDDEGIVLKAVVDDAIEVYSVKFNAIVYPSGFSDVDYSATEQSDNLWMYSFGSLDAGNYTFKVIASDGANVNDLTEYAYIDFVVREAVIIVEEITLIGAGEDFEMMTFSARINRDCSYTIYEESASSAESDTHTGSVTAPSFNLAWTKLDVDDSNVNFTIKFISGSLTYNYTSQYQVAQTTFYVSTVMQIEGLDTVTVTGRISKLGAWQLYDELHTLKDTGSITDLDFTVRFNKWSGYDEQDHDFAIKFTNGSQSCWYNSSYYAFKKQAVAPPVTTDENALYAFQVSFWTLIGVCAIGGMFAVDFYRKWK